MCFIRCYTYNAVQYNNIIKTHNDDNINGGRRRRKPDLHGMPVGPFCRAAKYLKKVTYYSGILGRYLYRIIRARCARARARAVNKVFTR